MKGKRENKPGDNLKQIRLGPQDTGKKYEAKKSPPEEKKPNSGVSSHQSS